MRQEVEALIGMAREGEGREAWLLHGDPELLTQFSDEGLLRPLAGLHLAAGKLPKACELLSFRALRQEDAVVLIDQGDSDHEGELERGHVGRIQGWAVASRMSRIDGFEPDANPLFVQLDKCNIETKRPRPNMDRAGIQCSG